MHRLFSFFQRFLPNIRKARGNRVRVARISNGSQRGRGLQNLPTVAHVSKSSSSEKHALTETVLRSGLFLFCSSALYISVDNVLSCT